MAQPTLQSLSTGVRQILDRHNVKPLSEVSPAQPMLITFGLPLRDESRVNWLLVHRAIFGHYLTQAQFTQQFAPTPARVRAVETWARRKGMTFVYASPDGLVVTVRGPASIFESALHVHIRKYGIGNATVYANTSAPLAPRRLGIQTISGLDNIQHAVNMGLKHSSVRKGTTPGAGYTPRYIRIAYDMCSWQNVNGQNVCAPYAVSGTPVDGTGETIGITGFGQSVPNSDLKAFAHATDQPAITSCSSCSGPDKIQWLALDGSNSDQTFDEQALDVEYVHGLALHSHLKYWLGDDGSDPGMEDAVAAAAADPSVHIVSNSWGDPGPESETSTNPFVKITTNSFKRADLVGTTFYFSTGDNAADSGCYYISSHCGRPSYPATSPLVVAVGGTNLQMNASLTSWASESTWSLQKFDDSGTGGGCAHIFARPSWQQGVAAATCSGRAIPDISAAGDLDNSPVQVWVSGGSELVGGTSVSASLISGMAAATNRYLSLEHAANPSVPGSMGFAAPEIYKLARSNYYNTYFHDVLCGSNTQPAQYGWDESTGWGSIDWYAYTEGFAGQTPGTRIPPVPYWTCTPQSETSAGLTSVACPASFQCHIAGASGTLRNTDDGWHWTSPQRTTAKSNIAALTCPTTSVCYALGQNGWLQTSRDSGNTWKARKLPVSSLDAMSCPERGDCYVVGAGILKISDGKRFMRVSDPSTGALIAVSCPSASVCYAIQANGTVVKTTDGTTWKVLAATPPLGSIASLTCPTAIRCFAVGSAAGQNSQRGVGLVYRTVDGTSWSSQLISSSGPLSAVSCSNAFQCDAVGPSGSVIRTTDGENWKTILNVASKSYDAVDCPHGRLCYAVGTRGLITQVGASPGN